MVSIISLVLLPQVLFDASIITSPLFSLFHAVVVLLTFTITTRLLGLFCHVVVMFLIFTITASLLGLFFYVVAVFLTSTITARLLSLFFLHVTLLFLSFHSVVFLLPHGLGVCSEAGVRGRCQCKHLGRYRDAEYLGQHVSLQPHDQRRLAERVVRPLVIEQQSIQLQMHQLQHYYMQGSYRSGKSGKSQEI